MASPTRPDACDGAPPLPAGQRIRIDADDARALDVLYIRREQCPHHVLFAPEAMLEVGGKPVAEGCALTKAAH